MDPERRPARYLVRTTYMNSGAPEDHRLWAYSAEDAVFQLETAMGKPRTARRRCKLSNLATRPSPRSLSEASVIVPTQM